MQTSAAGRLVSETLAPEPASVGRARRLVRAALAAAGYDEDVADVVTLLVSEVITNSLLHAGTEMGLRCERRGAGVRVEVFDRSALVPSVRHYDPEAATGRGLALVSTLAVSWGVRLHDHGKTLWFDVGDVGAHAAPGTEPTPGPEQSTELAFVVRLPGASPSLIRAAIEQGDALLRELALLTLGDEHDDAVPSGWQHSQIDVGPILAAAEAAAGAGQPKTDLQVTMRAGAGPAGMERLRLIGVADALAGGDRLLSAPALPRSLPAVTGSTRRSPSRKRGSRRSTGNCRSRWNRRRWLLRCHPTSFFGSASSPRRRSWPTTPTASTSSMLLLASCSAGHPRRWSASA